MPRPSQLAPRFFSAERHIPSKPTPTQDPEGSKQSTESSSNPEEVEPSTETPWFLEVEPPRHPPSLHTPTLPKAPEESPELVEPMIKYIYEDMGLDDISLMDLRDLDPPAALGPSLIMLFATARSERHLHISSGRFVRWLRRNYKVDARADGLIGPGELKTKLRRLRKKAKLMGTNTMILPGGDNGISTGWVCVNFSTSDSVSDESVNFDESGRFSGFGASPTGTTIVVQCMTEPRRNELNLETLWQGVLKRNLEQTMKIKGQAIQDKEELEKLVSSKIQQPDNPAAAQWQKMEQASRQQRYFSTSARRLRPQQAAVAGSEIEKSSNPNPPTEFGESQLNTLQRHITDLHISGTSLSQGTLERLISAVLHAPASEDSASVRLELVDQLLQSAEERGISVQSKDMLVALIQAIVTSPAYGPELERAQRNLEFLLLDLQTPLDLEQSLQLMTAYAERRDWDQFWDTFRAPSRFRVARSAELYELVYRVMVSTQDAKMCTDALRWVYPEMLKEEPPVYPTGAVYNALKACILVADPAAEELLHNPPSSDTLDTIGRRRLQHREFVRVLREVEDAHRHFVGSQAREERAQALHRFTDRDAPR
ncbi:mitochondrial protein required for the stability of Oli1p mRNA and for the Oli1p ring formation [Pochonia chlamydosporia 170]|uniref:ATPase synthesis protein 25 n=1 Tax=Pochonia chlamydosporia 170 TaxID=1380566 RepID=A0A179FKY2_METCM|nr:mitochondrial protein required for the stability of Oli1p mRNA and for the Oli1p ring formation [Pochonia chlamydosporia 170]OAQ65967.1 mitochondrial protein required for the stability of Oli1p mRNA and for the Oli1p ring formation [Pochonia chlamydosporia 170]